MGKTKKKLKADVVVKNYWRNNEQFADFFNAVLYEGKQVIKPDELEDMDTEESYVSENKKYVESVLASRDNIKIRKKSTKHDVELCILGMESQEHIHYAMPMRVMGYDYGSYKKQYDSNAVKYKTEKGLSDDEFISKMKRTDKFIPIITIVIYYGEKAWDGAVSLQGMLDIPEDMKADAEKYRQEMIEAAAEQDDELMMKYLDGEELSEAEIKSGLRKGTLSNALILMTCGSSYKNKGVQELLNAIVDYLPSPLDIPNIKGVDEDGNEVESKTDDNAPFAALAFKIMTDPYVGKLCFFRVYSGTCTTGTTILNATKDKKDRIGRILLMHANHRQDIEKVYAGDIAAAVGLKDVSTGDTLCDPDHPIILESMEFPEPVIDIAIEPKDKANGEKMGIALAKLAEEDPTFKTWTDQESGQTIIAGMGELHLDIIVDRLKREFKVECTVGKPQVSYKETIRNKVKVQGKFVRQSGGHGQYGDVWFEMEPLEPGSGVQFESKIVGGAVPKEYIKPIEDGLRESAMSGILAGYPVIDFKATLVDGSYHEVDSSEMAFKIAASMAFKEGCKQAKSVILEPIMKVEVTVPEEYMGDVIGDINSRRGRMEGMEARNGNQIIRGFIPLSEMFGYATDLRSKTQGRGTYSMEPSHYEEVPKSVLEQIVASRSKKAE